MFNWQSFDLYSYTTANMSFHVYITDHCDTYLYFAVWNELEKENREFFEAYAKSHNKNRTTEAEAEAEASTMIQKLILDHDHTKNSDKE